MMNRTDRNITPTPFALRLVLGLTLLLSGLSAHGFLFPFHTEAQYGAVMARGLVTPDGDSSLTNTAVVIVPYNTAGEEVGSPISLPEGHTLADIRIISRDEFQTEVDLLEDWRAENAGGLAEGARLLPREAFLGQSYTLADGQTRIAPPALHPTIKSVLVRPQVHRHRTDPNELALLRFTVDLSDPGRPGPNIRTLLLDRHGRIRHASEGILAPRTAFYGDPNTGQSSTRRTPEDTIFGPVSNVKVEVFYPGGVGVTDSEGRYSFGFWMICPPGGFDYPVDTHVSLRYRSFNPQGSPVLPYYLTRHHRVYCPAPPIIPGFDLAALMAYLEALAIHASIARPVMPPIDFYVDVMFLNGTLSLANPDGSPVPLAAETHYRVFDPDDTPVAAHWYDFDGDGRVDLAQLGRVERITLDGAPVDVFYPDPEGEYQGVYLSSNPAPNPPPPGHEEAGYQPDLIRLANTPVRREHTGLLGGISQEDLQNTDLLVFRESTGELIVERRGLSERDMGEAEQAGSLYYRLMMRGPRDAHWRNVGGGVDRRMAWGEWAADYGLEKPFRDNPENVLRVGERVSLVAINRATGYMDVQSVQLTSAGDGGGLNVPVAPLVLRPPNLKIWAQRRYAVEYGLTAGEQRRYLMGAEGAGLTSDTLIEVTTEWRAPDGRPLPEGLGEGEGRDFGLTGRLAKVVAPNELRETAEGGLAHFPIAPGRHTQVIQLRDNLTRPEHYYIHVSGTQETETPNFGNPQGGPLSGRPGRLTPFLVPLYDEWADWDGINRWRQTNRATGAGLPRPEPYYAWHYRPEYQFSRFSLEVEEIQRQTAEPDGETIGLLAEEADGQIPYISGSDEMITALYSLVAPLFSRLPYVDGPQELVFALGGQEVRAIMGANGQISFGNLSMLDRLSAADLLTLRLYSNQDAGNILWEYAFGQTRQRELPTTYDLARFPEDDTQGLEMRRIDHYLMLNIPVEQVSQVEVSVLDHRRDFSHFLVPSQAVVPDMHHLVVLRDDLGDCVRRVQVTDCYVSVSVRPVNGDPPRETLYEINNRKRVNGLMLGQVIEHDVLIQTGSLTLQRQDFQLETGGLPLGFSRSYSNVPFTEHVGRDDSISRMGPGWRHNHDLHLEILASREFGPSYRNELPGWVGHTRHTLTGPQLLDSHTLANLMPDHDWPSRVAVSGGGQFKRADTANSWTPQRGYHGELTYEDGVWEFRSKDGTLYRFEPPDNALGGSAVSGRIPVSRITDRNGNSLTYEYTLQEGQRLLSRVTDNAGRQLRFEYTDEEGHLRLTTVTAWDGVGVSFEYEPMELSVGDGDPVEMGSVLSSARRGAHQESYRYDWSEDTINPHLASFTDANGHVRRYDYHDIGTLPRELISGAELHQVVSQVHYPDGHSARLDYHVALDDNRREVVDLNGHTKTYHLNGVGNPVRVVYPENQVIAYRWSSDQGGPGNYMTRKTHEGMGAVWQYNYDAKGNLIEEVDPLGQRLTQSWDPDFAVLLSRTGKDGHTLTQTLDGNGNVIVRRQSAEVRGQSTEVETRHSYGAAGRYNGLLQSTTDGRNATTQYGYDGLGLLAEVTEPEGSRTRYVNDPRGRRISETDPNGHTTRYAYDDLDNLIQVTDAEGNRLEYDYDAKGNKTRELHRESYRTAAGMLERSKQRVYTYDTRDRVVSEVRSGSQGLGGQKTYGYDGNSNLLSETDWQGGITRTSYDGLNRPVSVTNRLGHSRGFSYAFAEGGLRVQETDTLGRVTSRREDALGRVVLIEHPEINGERHRREMTYDGQDRLLSVRDENGGVSQTHYDGRGLVVSETNPNGHTASHQYDEAGNRVVSVDEAGRVTEFTYDRQNRRLSRQAPEGQLWQYGYDPVGRLLQETDPWGHVVSYTYDRIGRRTSRTHPDGTEQEGHTRDGLLSYRRDAAGREISRVYDPLSQLVLETDPRGRSTQISYDANGNRLSETLSWGGAATGPGSVSHQYEYDAEDRLTRQTLAAGSAEAQVTDYTYDAQGNLLQEQRPDGRTTQWAYDARDRLIRTSDAQGGQVLRELDGLGHVLTETDRRGQTTRTTYDGLGRPLSVTYPDNTSRHFSYDPVGNVLAETNPRGHTLSWVYDGLDRVTEHRHAGTRVYSQEYDLGGARRHAVIDANGNRVETFEDWRGNTLATSLPGGPGYGASTRTNSYDASGFQLSATDESGLTTEYSRHPDGTLASVTNPAGETTQFEYDIFGNQARITRPLGGTQTLTRDARNRLVSVVDALGQETRYTYDANDNKLSHELPGPGGGHTRVSYAYDSLNRQISHTQHKADGNLTGTFAYDAEGNLTQRTDARGQVFGYSYDALGRLVEQTFPGGSDLNRITTSYDANGNVDTITEHTPGGQRVTSHSYDAHDRLVSQTQRGHTVSYSYDANGNRTAVNSQGGSSTYRYDTRNRLTQVSSNGALSDYRYRANGWLESLTHGNGTRADYSHDNAGRVTQVSHSLGDGSLLSRFVYQYDANGNRTRQEETQQGFQSGQVQVTDYVYDALDRLERYTETLDDGTVTDHRFTFHPSYDRASYRIEVDGELTQNRQYHYDETHWLTRIDEQAGDGGRVDYVYDANGNPISKTDSTGEGPASTLFAYNSRNQLIRLAAGEAGAEAEQGRYVYNHAGLRVQHLGSARGDIDYLYDGDSILEERLVATGQLLAHYRYADRLLSLNHLGEDQYYHQAALGTTVNLSTAEGEAQVAYRTDAFGQITQQAGESVNRRVFTGHEHDTETGLIYMKARFYDPAAGRFLNQDTYLGEAGNPPSLHRYLYAFNNPTVWVDPDGRQSYRYVNEKGVTVFTDGTGLKPSPETKMEVHQDDSAGTLGNRERLAQDNLRQQARTAQQAQAIAERRQGSEEYCEQYGCMDYADAINWDRVARMQRDAQLREITIESSVGPLTGYAASCSAVMDPDFCQREAQKREFFVALGPTAEPGGEMIMVVLYMGRNPTRGAGGGTRSTVRHGVDAGGSSSNRTVVDGTAQSSRGRYANRTNVTYRSADDVNAEFSGYMPPYQRGTRVTEYTTVHSDQFVRVHGERNAARSWMMRREAVQGLSPEEIARKYSLPEIPTHISDVNVPAGTRVRTGRVADNFGGNQGAIQYQWLGRVPEDAITNTRPLR